MDRFGTGTRGNDVPLNGFGDSALILLAKFIGAICGAAMSLAYVLPRGRREAALRFTTGLAAGMVFGTAAGLKIAVHLELDALLSPVEIALVGAAATSLCAWWALGIIARFAERYGSTRE